MPNTRFRRCALLILSATQAIACSSMSEMAAGESMAGGGTPSSASSEGGGQGQVAAGQLTAAEWDDNLNFEFFQSYAASKSGGLPSADRITIQVVNEGGEPVSNARVVVRCNGQPRLEAPTTTDGRLLFFPQHDDCPSGSSMTVTASPSPNQAGTPATLEAPEGSTWSLVLSGATRALPSSLDLAFVVDNTGSMGDEIKYLNAEMKSIADAVSKAGDREIAVRYGLVIYRDNGDEYVTRAFDFTSDVGAFQGTLGLMQASGGGDYEEAVDQAMQELHKLSWSQGNTARVAFHISDAPPHPQNEGAYLAQIDQARRSGIKIIPVAASGVADRAEFLYRTAALWTLSRYVFLTDDSGLGGAHQEPTIPCYQVQHLNHLMTRLVASELIGQYIAPDPSDILRTEGNPSSGVCTLDSGAYRLY